MGPGTAFCLEAVETSAPFIETDEEEIPTRIVAHFGAKSRAARIALEQGAEAVQPLSCALQPAPLTPAPGELKSRWSSMSLPWVVAPPSGPSGISKRVIPGASPGR